MRFEWKIVGFLQIFEHFLGSTQRNPDVAECASLDFFALP